MNVYPPLNHQQAKYWLHRSADQPLTIEQQAQLQAHIHQCAECRAYAQAFEQLQTHLPNALQSRWQPSSALQTRLGLERLHQRLHPESTSQGELPMQKIFGSVAWAMTLILLVATLGWLLRNSLPSLAPADSPPTIAAPLPVIASPTPQPKPLQLPTPTTETTQSTTSVVALLPQVSFELPQPLPESPSQLRLYRQILPEVVNEVNALQMAQRLQIENVLVIQRSNSNEGMPPRNFVRLSNGWQELTFETFVSHFRYTRAPQLAKGNQLFNPKQQIEPIAAYLQQLGLLTSPYRVQPAETNGFGLRFIPLVNDLPVYFSIGTQDDDWLSVYFDQSGAVNAITARLRDFAPLGDYPMLNAAQAWQRLNAPNALERARYAVLSPQTGEPYRAWLPNYEPGLPVDLYDYLNVNSSEDGSNPAVVTINNWVVANPPAELLELYLPDASAPIVHLQGVFETNSSGYTQFVIQNWEALPPTANMLFARGYLQRGTQTTMITDDGETLRLLYLPDAIPDGVRLEVSGLRDPNQPDLLHWDYLATGDDRYTYQQTQTCFGGGGGGIGDENAPLPFNFGAGSLANFNPHRTIASNPIVTTVSAPSVGTRLDRLTGKVYVERFWDKQGQPLLHYTFVVENPETLETTNVFTLVGNIQGLDAYLHLPMQIWGTITESDPALLPPGMMTDAFLNVERYEPLYPDAHLAEFVGTLARVTLQDANEVVLLTTADGAQYLLNTSLLYGAQDAFVGQPDSMVEIEGYLTGETLQGYPILSVVSAGTPPDGIVSSAQIYDWIPPEAVMEQPLSGAITIHDVELAYSGVWLDGCLPEMHHPADEIENWLVLQPVWIFRGIFDDGRLFEIQIQALPDEYLK